MRQEQGGERDCPVTVRGSGVFPPEIAYELPAARVRALGDVTGQIYRARELKHGTNLPGARTEAGTTPENVAEGGGGADTESREPWQDLGVAAARLPARATKGGARTMDRGYL